MPDLQDVQAGSRVRLPCGCVGVTSYGSGGAGSPPSVVVEGEPVCQPHNGVRTIVVHPRTQVVVLGTVDTEDAAVPRD
jgi:hypothetical protein